MNKKAASIYALMMSAICVAIGLAMMLVAIISPDIVKNWDIIILTDPFLVAIIGAVFFTYRRTTCKNNSSN